MLDFVHIIDILNGRNSSSEVTLLLDLAPVLFYVYNLNIMVSISEWSC